VADDLPKTWASSSTRTTTKPSGASYGETIPPVEPVKIEAAEFVDRRLRASKEAQRRGLDALLVWGRGGSFDAFSDVFYFANHYSPMVWVPPLPGVLSGCEHAALLIVDGHGALIASDFVASGVQVDEIRRGWDLGAELVELLRERGADRWRIGVVGEEVLPFGIAARVLDELPGVSLEGADEISAVLRSRLSAAEVSLLRRAGEVGGVVYRAFLESVAAGASEGEAVGASAAVAAQIPGCLHWNHISSSGPRAAMLVSSSMPPWEPERRFAPGDIVHADCFGYVDGYCYDLARTVVVDGPDAQRRRDTAARTREAVREVAAALRPGVSCGELYAIGRRALESRGLSPLLGTFGHGIGAGFFRPYLLPAGPDLNRQLEPPCGISIEMFAGDGGGGYAYHEDNFVVLDRGTICVTDGV
jgi:Xaa-Pro aminopeptidase